MQKYQLYNGTSYHIDTPLAVIRQLDWSMKNRVRIVLDYGDVKTGKSWGEVNDREGHIGRSTGDVKIPLLIKTKRSLGGGGILDHCIIGIKTARGKKVLYKL